MVRTVNCEDNNKIRETGSINDLIHSGCPSTQKIDAGRDTIGESPGTPIRHHAQEMDISRSSPQNILTQNLHLHANKLQLIQDLQAYYPS